MLEWIGREDVVSVQLTISYETGWFNISSPEEVIEL